jgi:hypothetical protein
MKENNFSPFCDFSKSIELHLAKPEVTQSSQTETPTVSTAETTKPPSTSTGTYLLIWQ